MKTYPRTPYFETAAKGFANIAESDKYVVTEKLDGECTCLSRDSINVRSRDFKMTPWRRKVFETWNVVKWDIEPGITICGENLWITHSIWYRDLPVVTHPFFFVFAVCDGDEFLSWKDITSICKNLELETVPVKCIIGNDIKKIKKIGFDSAFTTYRLGKMLDKTNESEGFVVRNYNAFRIDDFDKNVFKCIRQGYNQPDGTWIKGPFMENSLRNE